MPVLAGSTPEFSMMGSVIFAGYTSSGATNFHSARRSSECAPGSDIRSIPGGTLIPTSACCGSDMSEISKPPRQGNASTRGVNVTRTFARSCRSCTRTGTRTPKTYAAKTTSAPVESTASSSNMTSSELLPITFTPPITGGWARA